MARRADHTREELTELAVTAGRQLIKTEGFSGFSARKVASAIGYTVGTLYNVFGSYDEMILHINAATLDEWFTFMEAALKRKSGGPAIAALAKAYIEFSQSHYQQWIALFEYHVATAELPKWYVEKMGRFFALVEDALQPQQKDKRKARRAAHVLWAGIHGIAILSTSGKLDVVEAESAETLAMSFIETYLKGLSMP